MYPIFITAYLKLSDELEGQLVPNSVMEVKKKKKKKEALHLSNSLFCHW